MNSIVARIDNVTGIGSDYRNTVCPPPRSVKIELTAECNLRCTYCVKSIRNDSGEMDRKMFSRLIREIYDAGVLELGLFFIGESFICKWLPDAIREAKEVGFPYVFLTTNGSAATPARVEACMKAGLDSLKFSLNFATRSQFAEVAGVGTHLWTKAIENLKTARLVRDMGEYDCGIYASSIAYDGQQGERMKELVSEIESFVDEHYWLPLFGMGGAAKANGWKPKPGNPGRLDRMRDPLPCWSVLTEGHITHDGKMVACCFGSGIDGDLVMADLKQVGFMEGWNSAEYQKLRAAHLSLDVSQTACADCAAG